MSFPNDVYELRFTYIDGPDRMQCVQHYKSTATSGTEPEQSATNLANAWHSANVSALLNVFPSSTYLTSLRARRINNSGGPSFYGPFGASLQGTAGPDAKVDASIAALLTAPYDESDLDGPDKFRVGRLFLGCVPFSWLMDNVWTSGAVANYGGLASALSSLLTSGSETWYPVVWSKKYAGYTPPVTWAFQPTIACMRKRAFPTR